MTNYSWFYLACRTRMVRLVWYDLYITMFFFVSAKFFLERNIHIIYFCQKSVHSLPPIVYGQYVCLFCSFFFIFKYLICCKCSMYVYSFICLSCFCLVFSDPYMRNGNPTVTAPHVWFGTLYYITHNFSRCITPKNCNNYLYLNYRDQRVNNIPW